ncbi:hypothetical protein HMPREF0044_0089 [Gleimia coleocanis DSM 15436]|uniref:GmrSD restriction endonucleases C-terminal domain-containing protein n=1 Tax=Gleimia coleocanis DSM 15436 TaxID=525245 RepID=C0VY49_9ACTO|nr:HNH endonuclease family protein [Gleimia coleocanis]EEH64352.1 hypothetical protein HMPREF0044_0089 [Gleimia coleocanis DSM 15436]
MKQPEPRKTSKPADLIIYLIIGILFLWLLFTLKPDLLRTLTGQNQLADIPASTAKTALQQLEIRPRTERAPEYQRNEFGESWADVDGNGCDTRNDILGRDLIEKQYRRGSNCVVKQGLLEDPYTGEKVAFIRGPQTSEIVQIDHVVALGDAWRSGAYKWDLAKREAFANDPENLLAVVGYVNEDKGRSRADQWLPPQEEYHCAYVARQIKVKAKWQLSIISSEKETFVNVLANCPATG